MLGQDQQFTSRLQKGGALLEDMRMLVRAWSDGMEKSDPVPELVRILPKVTVARVRDTYIRAFRPRFINGSPQQAWRLARALEDETADSSVVRPLYYWITARAETPIYQSMTDVLYPQSRSGNLDVRSEDAATWLARQVANNAKEWTPTVARKVARGLLAALRDFGILEGANHKTISPAHLTPAAGAIIAFCLHELGSSGRELVQHLDWRLFLLGETGVERMLMECHQHGWLRFDIAGAIYRVEFPSVSLKEYVHDVLGPRAG